MSSYQFSPQSLWTKTRPGKIFLTILLILALALITFACLTGYYLWQLKFGNPEQLAAQFKGEFTSLNSSPNNNANPVSAKQVNNIIRNYNPQLGQPDAQINIVAFINFSCPHCQTDYQQLKQIINTYQSVARITFKHFPIAELFPDSLPASLAAEKAMPFLRKISIAFSASPPASSKADLQSNIPAPVLARRFEIS